MILNTDKIISISFGEYDSAYESYVIIPDNHTPESFIAELNKNIQNLRNHNDVIDNQVEQYKKENNFYSISKTLQHHKLEVKKIPQKEFEQLEIKFRKMMTEIGQLNKNRHFDYNHHLLIENLGGTHMDDFINRSFSENSDTHLIN